MGPLWVFRGRQLPPTPEMFVLLESKIDFPKPHPWKPKWTNPLNLEDGLFCPVPIPPGDVPGTRDTPLRFNPSILGFWYWKNLTGDLVLLGARMDSSSSLCPKFLNSPGRWSFWGFAFPKYSLTRKVSGATSGVGWAKQSGFTDCFPYRTFFIHYQVPFLFRKNSKSGGKTRNLYLVSI